MLLVRTLSSQAHDHRDTAVETGYRWGSIPLDTGEKRLYLGKIGFPVPFHEEVETGGSVQA